MAICLSGGAKGADLAWGLAAIDAGHDVVHFSFRGHNPATSENIHTLTQDELNMADEPLKLSAKSLKRSIPFHKPWIANLLRRNWYQVRETTSIYAVSKIDQMSQSRSCVTGGTAWAVEMAIDLGVPKIYVFDQIKERWFYWNCAHWLEGMTPPKPTGVWTGIGSRELTDAGLQSIIDVFEQSKI